MIHWPELSFPPLNLWNVWKMDKTKQPKDTVNTANFKHYTNTKCEFFPCHDLEQMKNPDEFNCLFCYCPLQYLECPGPYTVFLGIDGVTRKDCSACVLPHDGFFKSWNFIQHWLKKPEPWKWEDEKIDMNYMEAE